MAESSRANRIRRRVPEHDIFLSHSGQQKPFVEQLFYDFRGAGKHPFFDQDRNSLPKAEPFPPNIVDAAEQCEMGVVVVSEDYLKSYWPMVELNLFVESKVKLFPLFFKLSPSDLKQDKLESTWKPAWRDMGMEEEVVESWGKAVKALRISNGLEFAKYSNSEHKYRLDVVSEICKQLPPILKSKTSDIKGYERLCKTTLSMFEGNEYLGLYGMAGAGKSTLCKAMCNYNQGEFGANVYRVELTSDQAIEQLAGNGRLTRLKQVLQHMGVGNGILERILIEEEGWEWLKETLRGKARIFLAIDNVGNARSSKKEAQSYLEAGLPVDSKVLMTSRSRDILEDVLGCREYCKPLPRLEQDKALELFLSIAAPKKSSSSFNEEEKKIVERCLGECQYANSGYTSTQFHPLILKALGSYFHDVDKLEGLSWKEALENNDKLQRSEDGKNVNYVLGLNYKALSNGKKMIYLDTVLYPHHGYARFPWWTSRTGSSYDAWVLWISEVHNMSPSNARMILKELQRLSLLEDSILGLGERNKPYAHDLYREFVRGLVEEEGGLEWKWWMSQVELGNRDELMLKRLVLKGDKSLIGRPPKKLQEWRSLVFLELCSCNGFGRDNVLDIGGLTKLRVLVVEECATLRRIICSCDEDEHNQKFTEKIKRDHCEGLVVELCETLRRIICSCDNERNNQDFAENMRGGYCQPGCMTELCCIKLQGLDSLEDMSFLRHCPNIEILRVLCCNGSIYPSRKGNSQNPHAMDLRHLKKLHTLIVWEDMEGIDVDTFSKWLSNTLQLQELGALEYVFRDKPLWLIGGRAKVETGGEKNCRATTMNLSEGVSTSNLSVLSMRLPSKVEEIQGLQFLSSLTTLNLNSCQELWRLPNLKKLLNLKEVCLGGCPLAKDNDQSLIDFLPQSTRRYIMSPRHAHNFLFNPGELFKCFGCDFSYLVMLREEKIRSRENLTELQKLIKRQENLLED